MNTLQKQFSFENTQIRTIVNEETVWFCFLDICAILGDTHYRRTFNSLDEDEKTMLTLPTTGGQQEMQVINESGLYTILIRSKSEKAKPFRRWVTHDVLPTLRKQGYYACMSDEQVFDFVCERAATSKLLLGSITNTKCILSRVKEVTDRIERQKAFEREQERKRLEEEERKRKLAELWEIKDTLDYKELVRQHNILMNNHGLSLTTEEWSGYFKERSSREGVGSWTSFAE